MAANTSARWQANVLGVELLDGGPWTATAIRDRYAEAFRSYEELADPRPTCVPTAMNTHPVGSPARVDVAGVPWQIRVCRVRAEPEDWSPWEPFLTPEQTALAAARRAKRP